MSIAPRTNEQNDEYWHGAVKCTLPSIHKGHQFLHLFLFAAWDDPKKEWQNEQWSMCVIVDKLYYIWVTFWSSIMRSTWHAKFQIPNSNIHALMLGTWLGFRYFGAGAGMHIYSQCIVGRFSSCQTIAHGLIVAQVHAARFLQIQIWWAKH